ncbi:MAG: NarK family nitrate/nitrite MFS transporter [Actinobacteria bacterium]|nr:NarK family nitrate/nitrite MFS transporter [Actinomycetota bacterium]MBW3642266.1 NarK family nitrate/nitrite MFS transporter [Actinomycetota bacterium]
MSRRSPAMSPSRWINTWEPEDETFWSSTGRSIARRNLIFSIFAELLGFSVWLLWSVTATRLNDAGFDLSSGQLFTLVAVPALVGATVRFPYTFAVPRFGGRNWTVFSALALLIPTTLLVVLVNDPTTPYWALLLAAATAGLGGGNFASSMANISFFFPDREKGWALGLNAAGGNIGVAILQLTAPVAITLGASLQLRNAGLMLMPFIVLAALCAWRYMDNLSTARSSFRDQVVVARNRHTWIISWLYIGTFGSFIGYSAGLPLLMKQEFADPNAIKYAFLGPLVGSIARPIGGKLADRLGGAKVTLCNFSVMISAVLGVVVCLGETDAGWSFPVFVALFLMLFVTTGIGNGTTFRMVPVIFRAHHVGPDSGDGGAQPAALVAARRESAAVLGLTSAVGAYGGFLIPQGFGLSTNATGGPQAALLAFAAFYGSCVVLTWWCYLRRRVAVARVPNLAWARP